ncbi:MAG: ACT domain-containing protein [Erysipelotrichaceae bacterium]|nr:ACT domain-containing protein [Erysipelotrichaceae bacterium]MDY5251469.1 ACT domain-containing protein [Erysipelotrichaceae bacterium]
MSGYLIVHSSILPSCFYTVIKVREYLQQNPNENVKEACQKFAISRSTYYKYKDLVFLPNNTNNQKAVISLALEHEQGNLSNVLNALSDAHANILTISQALPINNIANVNVTLDISTMSYDLSSIIHNLTKIKGVINANLINIE